MLALYFPKLFILFESMDTLSVNVDCRHLLRSDFMHLLCNLFFSNDFLVNSGLPILNLILLQKQL